MVSVASSPSALGLGNGLLIVVAHPDDESFGAGGVAALLSAQGVPVHILIATDGDAGEITVPELDTPEARANLGKLRREEAKAAAAVVGAEEVRFLGHRDGGLSRVDPARLISQIARSFAELQPAVVVTFGPDGIYGHPDHLAISAATTRAFADAPAGPSRLFYLAMTEDRARQLNDETGPIEIEGVTYAFTGRPPNDVTTTVDIRTVVERKFDALACHRTQTGGRIDWLRSWLDDDPIERFILARRRIADAPGLGSDLFAGIDGN